MNLAEYVQNHTERGACQCGQCLDKVAHPENEQPTGHTADLVFFKVSAANNPDKETLTRLIKETKGEFCEVDLLDGKEHGYIEIGAWIGDQGLAMQLMGLGTILGLWKLLTPYTVLGKLADSDLAMKMAGAGFLTIVAKS